MNNDENDETVTQKKPKRYPLHWEEGLRPDEEDMKYETVGEEE
jgi:hypothetical protein